MDFQKRVLWEPTPAWMDKLSLMGARFVEGNTNEAPPAEEPSTTPDEEQSKDPGDTGAKNKADGDEPLGEKGLKALAAERDARKKAEAELKEARDEIQRLTQTEQQEQDREGTEPSLKDLELRLIRSEVLLNLDHPIPKEYQHLVKGESQEEIEASAKAISELVHKPGVVNLSGTGDGESGGTVFAGRQLYQARHKKN